MKPTFLSVVVLSAVFASHIHAELPRLKEEEWYGYFVASKNRKSLFGVSSNIETKFNLLDNKGQILRAGNPVKINFQVIEINPAGNYTRKTIDAPSLTSKSEAAVNPRSPVTISGKVTDNAAFETTLKIAPVGFTATGKITETGTIKNPLFFGINIVFEPYKSIELNDPKKAKEFRKEARRDKLEIITLTKEEKTYGLEDQVNFSTEFPDGVASITLKSHRYEDVEYVITASQGSAIHFQYKKQNPVYNSLNLLWKVKEGADPAAETLTMKAD